MNKKKIVYLGTAGLILVLIIITLFLIFKKQKYNCNNPDFSKYISAYTSGMISKASSIKIKLLSEIVNLIENKQELPKDLFDISPDVKGTLQWTDQNTIEFKPEKLLPANKTYTINFKLGKLVKNIAKPLSSFIFPVQTIKQNFEITIDEQKTIDRKTLALQKIIGTLRTADIETTENIQKTIEVVQNNRTLPVTWKVESDLKTFTFEIDSIRRTKESTMLKVKYNGNSIDVDKSDYIAVEIPSIDEFKYISHKVIQQPEQFLQIQFSDPIDDNQDLNGLISINNSNASRFVVADNVIRIYPNNRLSGVYTINLQEGIQNILGSKIKTTSSINVSFDDVMPAVRKVNRGVILPASEKGMVYPFEAVNLKAIDVKVIKIFENNITQFLQVNELDGENELVRVGKPVLKKTIFLNKTNIVDYGKWNRFYIDLNDLIKTEPGAIYRISLSFNKKYSLYACGDTTSTEEDLQTTNEKSENEQQEASYWDNYQNYYEDYSEEGGYWNNRNNPCKKAYYNNSRFVSQNIIASNFGLLAKKGNDGTLKIFVTDLRTTKPLKDVKIEIYNFQNQLIKTQATDGEGSCTFDKLENPFFVVAKQDDQRGYLKINDGMSLSLSKFDIAGTAVNKGLKGYIFGERGVWRPGDSLFITFVLKEDENNTLPQGHPVILEIKNPKYQLFTRLIQEKNKSGFYSFKFNTPNDALTGNWEAKVSVGGAVFTKSLKIETVKPNRLKINLDFGKKFLTANTDAKGNLSAKWLHGVIAKNLDAKIELFLNPAQTLFPQFAEYSFDDPTKRYTSEPIQVFDGTLDNEGKADFTTELKTENNAPGKMFATFVTKVFEKGGDFSIDQLTIPFYPYESFVGIRLPKGDRTRGMLLTDTLHQVDIVSVDMNGNLVAESHSIELSFYKLEWKWWWDKSEDSYTNFQQQNSYVALKKETINTSGGMAKWNIRVNYPDWGRYMVYAHDLKTGHTSAKIVYIDWPNWAGRGQKEQMGASMLPFSANKDTFNVGENVVVTIPSSKGGRALISIENGSKVIQTYWVETKQNQTEYKFKVTEDMTPNVYVNVTLLQPHAKTSNDLPIRLYGVIPIYVVDKSTHLEPVIQMPDVLEAEKPFSITVSEKNNEEMTYTIAIVDEGLLDLTRFRTPNPWDDFYAKEALGVKTWDIFDFVIGAFGGDLERLLAIGGDLNVDEKGKNKKANRFKPVVQFLGPYTLKRGSNTHTVNLPPYVGSVRTMVVAGNNRAFGSAEKTTAVKKPLMLLGTMPRVIGPKETVKLPVSVFVMDKNIKNVAVTINTNELFKIEGANQKNIYFREEGEEFVSFDLKVNSSIGIGKVNITSSAGNYVAKYDVEIDVRNPNPRITKVLSKVLSVGESWSDKFVPLGIKGTNKGTIEISSIPPMNLEKRLNYLITYPHGCIEQITSGAFPQLYVSNMVELNNNQKADIERNIKAAIQRLQSFQMFNGGLSYWPGENEISEWGTSYAGHFLLEAEKKGYAIPSGMLKGWKKYQQLKSQTWTDDGYTSQIIQAYRLYTLALAGNADESAMNRLKERTKLSDIAKWRLAGAYFLAGKKDVAARLISGLSTYISPYNELSYTYGSATRDEAMILEVLALLGKQKEAFELVKEISQRLCSEEWYSTQTTAYSLIAISKYMEKNKIGSQLKYSYTFNGQQNNIAGNSTISLISLPITETKTYPFEIKNTSNSVLYARIVFSGIPEEGEKDDDDSNLKMEIVYKTIDGKKINPEKLDQGTDFVAEVKITNPGKRGLYKEMALSQIFPSGWEIINPRMQATGNIVYTNAPRYQDYRDDRVLTYFDIDRNHVRVYKVLLHASYIGKFYLPTTVAEAMYDASIYARKKGMWVEVVKD